MKTILLLAALGLAGASARADVILAYDVNGLVSSPVPASLAPSVVFANLDGGDVTRGTGLTASGAANAFSSTSWNITDTFDTDSDFLTLTFQADPGYMLSLDSVTYRMQATSTAPNQARWGYRIGAGAWTLQTPYALDDSTGGGDGSWSGLGLSDITAPVEFRFWVWGTTQADGSGAAATSGAARIRNLAGNDLVFDGTVTAIPEPSSLLLGLVAGLSLFALRRK